MKNKSARQFITITTICLAALGLILSSSCAQMSAFAANESSSAAISEKGVQETVLANGLKVLLLEEHSFPVASTMVFYRVGSRNENLGETGLSHLVEHLLFEKVGRFRKGEMGATIARNGGMFNGFTSDDFTVFFETVSPSKLPLTLQIESERMHAATFTAEDVLAEIKRVEKELGQEAKDPVNLLNKEVRSAAFLQHPYRNPTIGWPNDVHKLTVDDVRRHYREYYQPGNATLVVVGDFNSAAVMEQINKYFAPLPKAEPPKAVRVVEPQQTAERRVYLKHGGNSDVVAMAYHSCDFVNADAPALAVLEKLLASGVSGRLKSKMVDAKVCSSAKCTFEVKRDPGLFTVNLVSTPGTTAHKMIESFEAVMEQLRTNPVPEAELRRARNHAEFFLLSERDGPYRTAFHLGYSESIDSWKGAYTWFTKIRAVSPADIQRVAKRYFARENRYVGVLSGAANKPLVQKPAINKDKDSADAKENSADKKSKDKKEADKDLDKKDGKKPADKLKDLKKPKSGVHHKTACTNATDIFKRFGVHACAYKSDDAQTVGGSAPAGNIEATNKTSATSSLTSSPNSSSTSSPNPHLKKATLKNGITVAVLETKLSPSVHIVGAVKAGEAYEPTGKRGAAAVLAQLMIDGSPKYSRQSAVNLQDELGLLPSAMIKFDAGPQWISFQSRCLNRDTGTILGILASQLRDPLLKDSDVERAKQLVIDRVKKSEDTVRARVKRALMQSLIAPNTSFYPLEPMDKARFVGNLKDSDLRDFHSQAVRPDATTIVFVGDITLNQAVDLAERSFEGWTGKSTAKKVLVQPNARRTLKSSMTIDKKQDTMVTIGRLVDSGLGKSDYPLMLLADCALTSHPIFSRFAQKISGEQSLSSSLSLEDLTSDVESLPGMTVWSLDIPLVSNAMPQAVKFIQTELKKFGRTGLTAEEFAEVKLYLHGALPVRWMSNSQLAARATLESVMLDGSCDPLPSIHQGIRAATLDKANQFVRTTFKPDRATVVIAGTKQAIQQIHGVRDESGINGSGSSQ